MKRVFGVRGKLEDTFPEQQVSSARPHFREYISPSELHDDIQDIPEPNNMRIRSTVVSRAPTFRNVPSVEMLRSTAGSIRDVSTSPAPPQTPIHALRRASVATDCTSTWNSTLDKRSAAKKRLSIIDENTPHRVRESIYEPPGAGEACQPGYEVRRVYSALMKRLDEGSPDALQERQEYVHGPGYGTSMYYMAPGLGLRPEDEGMFERPLTAVSTTTVGGTIRKSHASKWVRPAKAEQEKDSDPFYIPSITELPVVYGPAVRKRQTYDEITTGWQKDMEVADEGQMRVVSALKALSPVATSDRNETSSGSRARTTSSPTPPITVHNPQRNLRATRSSTFFPYPIEEESRESTPSPYKRARSTEDIKSRFGRTGTRTILGEIPAPPPLPPLRPPPLPPGVAKDASCSNERAPRGTENNPNHPGAKGKFKIRGNLKMKDYYPDKGTIATNSGGAGIGTGGQGANPDRNRNALTERTSRDIENAVNSQFGPVAGRGNALALKSMGGDDSRVGSMAFI
jgi:hypothetical protein